jgi:deoxyribonuclease V
MIVAVDVHYREDGVDAACAGVLRWDDPTTAFEYTHRSTSPPAPYEPGQFFKRELPHLLLVVEAARRSIVIEAIIVDGHAWLSPDQPGLGAHLHAALHEHVPVVGVAKNEFKHGAAVAVLRGQSLKPLYVSAAGMDASRAAALVVSMHGPHRLPTLLKRTDQLARGTEQPATAQGG